jgi:hypothetical protein
MKTTIDIPEPLYKKAKIRAIERGVTLKQIVLDSLEREMESPLPTPVQITGSRWANRKLRPTYRQMMESGALKPNAGSRSIDDIVAEIKNDPAL